MRSSAALALLAATPALATSYNLVKSFSGSSFFNGWDFVDGFDNTTNGHVVYQPEANATAQHLAFVNDAGHAIIKLDNTSFVPFNFKRNSVKIVTHDFFPVGSVFLFDALHLPFGCSVWPSFWTMGQNWPLGGEIDIFEGVNKMTFDQMTLHAIGGCTQAQGATQLGKTVGADCSAGRNSSQGCTVQETQPNSFGDGFNNNGGGVWAAQFDQSGIFIWFWGRGNIPADVQGGGNTIDTASWGTPSAAWPSSSCDVSKFFAPQQLVIDITLCGDFAGQPNIYQQTCGGPLGNSTVDICYIDNVINNGTSDYANAFFEIQYVKVFSNTAPLVASGTALVSDTSGPTGTASAGSPSSSGTAGAGTDSGSGSGKNGVAAVDRVRAGLVAWAVSLGAAFAWALL
ncbi:concanavalin A-like lectin/glucanase domain-containing protein [Trametes polyzona]|nr:concanavalin A-like lectin/glucanase domain-containing protein [Trametes polyzona]